MRGRTGPEVARGAVLATAAVGAGAVCGMVGTAAYFARRVLTPERDRPADTPVLAVASDAVTLGRTPETVVPGRYGLWFGERGHAQLGELLDLRPDRVVRRLGLVTGGRLQPGAGRWTGCYYAQPTTATMGLATRGVGVPGGLGVMPGWLIEPPVRGDRWAVLVHGRGATRDEGLRAVPVLHALGITCLLTSYRNDDGAPASPDGRYTLGLGEWHDVESAIRYAAGAGARSIVLVGWSMGGAIILQTLSRSWTADLVEAVVLDAPVVDWGDVLRHHARLHRVPPPIGAASTLLMGRRWTRRLAGVHEPVDVARTNWVRRADELRHRMLVIHSEDDEFVPCGPSRRLAEVRPDLVRMHRWGVARHTKEWNLDPRRWDEQVAAFLG